MRPALFSSVHEAAESNARRKYVASQDGQLYEVRESEIGKMVAPALKIDAFEQVNPAFEFSLPKIPATFLSQIISFFKTFTTKGNYEVMVIVYWDRQEEKYVLNCPKQIVTSVSINVFYDEQFLGRNRLRYIPVLEIHSHNVMRAFFSTVDDADETEFGLYGVIGRLNQDEVEMIFRVKANQSYVIVLVHDIFDLSDGIEIRDFPEEWVSKVQIGGLKR